MTLCVLLYAFFNKCIFDTPLPVNTIILRYYNAYFSYFFFISSSVGISINGSLESLACLVVEGFCNKLVLVVIDCLVFLSMSVVDSLLALINKFRWLWREDDRLLIGAVDVLRYLSLLDKLLIILFELAQLLVLY